MPGHPEHHERMFPLDDEPTGAGLAAVLTGLALVVAIILAGLLLLPADGFDSTADFESPASTAGSGPSE
jgi:hypothetical protein